MDREILLRLFRLIRPIIFLASVAIFTLNAVALANSTGGRFLVQKSLAEMEASLNTLALAHIAQDQLEVELSKLLLADEREWVVIESLQSVAASQGYTLSESLTVDLDAAREADHGWRRKAVGCIGCGLDAQTCDLSIAMACGIAVELTPLGDVAGLTRAGISFSKGEEIDKIDVGLSVIGLGATAMAFTSGGSSLSVKAGAAFMKFAHRAGRIPAPIARTLQDAANKGIAWSKLSSVRNIDDLVGIVRLEEIKPMVEVVTALGTTATKTGPRQGIYLLDRSENLIDFKRVSATTEVLEDKTAGYFSLLGKSRVLRATLKIADEVYWLLGSLVGILSAIGNIFLSLGLRILQRLFPQPIKL